MSDSNIELILDALSTAVAAVTPAVLPGFAFLQYQGSTPLENADDTQALRYFEWRDTGAFGVGPAVADATSCWYQTVLELRVFYPLTILLEGYSVARGLVGVRLRDRIDLNKALMFNDPLSSLVGVDYKALQLVDARMTGKILSLFYRVNWGESLA